MAKDEKEIPLEQKDLFRKRLHSIRDHILNVQQVGFQLVDKLIDEGEFDLARKLSSRLLQHDLSKLEYPEWDLLFSDKEAEKKIAIECHRKNNPHHIQYHSNILHMSEVDIAEFCVDIKARASEFGTDVLEYFRDKFCEQNGIKTTTNFYKRVMKYFKLILNKDFQ